LAVPRELELRFERRVEKQLPVRVTNEFAARTGFAIMSPPQVEPETVTVTGPAPVISQLQYIETDSTRFENLDRSISESIDLMLPDTARLTASDSVVTIFVEVEPKREKLFAGVSIEPPSRFDLDRFAYVPETLSLRLEIPESMVDSFTIDSFDLYFKQPAILRDSVRTPLRLNLPDKVSVVGALLDSVLIVPRDEDSGN
jgi:hypothetical protein